MGLLRTSSGGGQALRGLRGSRARSSGLGEAGAGFRPLCLRSLRPGHSRSRRESLQRPPTGLRRPESTLWPTPGRFSLSGCRSARSHLCPPAASPSLALAPAPARQPPSPASKPEVRVGASEAKGACARAAPATLAGHRLQPASGPG